jgi:hypothetical protein
MKVHFLFLILAALAAMVMANPPPPCSHAHLEWKQSRGTWKPKKDKDKQCQLLWYGHWCGLCLHNEDCYKRAGKLGWSCGGRRLRVKRSMHTGRRLIHDAEMDEGRGNWKRMKEIDEDDESVGRPGFIGSTFRHSVYNQRPEVHESWRHSN